MEESRLRNVTQNPSYVACATLLLVVATTALALACQFVSLTNFVFSTQIPFDTDEADHANPALNVMLSLETIFNTSPSGFNNSDTGGASEITTTQAIINQGFYPPLHSIVVALSYLTLGISYTTSRFPSVVCLVLSAVLLGLISYRRVIDRLAISPSGNLPFESLALAITTGATLTILTISSPTLVQNSVLCMLEPLALLLFSILLLLPVQPIIFAVGVLVIFLTKYSLALPLMPAISLAFLFNRRENLRTNAKNIATFLAIFTLGATIWLLVGSQEQIYHFLFGHPKYAPLLALKNLFFYPGAWLYEYQSHWTVSLGALLLTALGAAASRRDIKTLLLVFIPFTSYLIYTYSRVLEARHIYLVAPTLWLLAVEGVLSLKINNGRKLQLMVGVFCALLLLHTLQIPKQHRMLTRALEGKTSYGEVINFTTIRLDPTKPILITGTFDSLSLETFRWNLAVRGHIPYTAVTADPFPFDAERSKERRLRGRNPDSIESRPEIKNLSSEELFKIGYYQSLVTISHDRESEKLAQATSALFPTTEKSEYQSKDIRVSVNNYN